MSENAPHSAKVVRLLDANFNRAREAIRLLEDAARFLLDDPALAEKAKDMRHRLTAAAMSLPVASRFCSARDTPGDVGTALTAPPEQHRPAPADVVDAAAGRLSEALRALEEYAKLFDAEAASRFEQLRYESYELHKRLALRLRPRTAVSRIRLYVLVTAELCRGDFLHVAESALAGGADCLQLREKDLPDAELLERARALVGLCRRYDALCIINDRPDIAFLAGADGVHLGQDDLPVPAARKIVGAGAIIGKSTHSLAQALEAAAEGPDYVAVGPMFASATKPQEHIAGLATLREVADRVRLPLVAIGGITPDSAGEVLAAGAQAVAVCQAVIGRTDPKSAAASLRAVLDSTGS